MQIISTILKNQIIGIDKLCNIVIELFFNDQVCRFTFQTYTVADCINKHRIVKHHYLSLKQIGVSLAKFSNGYPFNFFQFLFRSVESSEKPFNLFVYIFLVKFPGFMTSRFFYEHIALTDSYTS